MFNTDVLKLIFFLYCDISLKKNSIFRNELVTPEKCPKGQTTKILR